MTEQSFQPKEIANTAGSSSPIPAPMVERAFRLLDILSVSEEGLTLSDLARALDMSKGSIHGLLKTLESSRVVEQSEERRYILGPRLYDLAQVYIQRAGLRRFALPAMQRLAASTAETVILGRIEQDSVRIIECVQGEGELHIVARRGMHVPLLAGAIGRVVLANWPPEKRLAYLQNQPLPHFTEHSVTDPQRYLAAVEEAALSGVGIERGEYLVGVNAVAAPIYTGPERTLTALLWIVGFASRLPTPAINTAGQHLLFEAAAISQALGSKSST